MHNKTSDAGSAGLLRGQGRVAGAADQHCGAGGHLRTAEPIRHVTEEPSGRGQYLKGSWHRGMDCSENSEKAGAQKGRGQAPRSRSQEASWNTAVHSPAYNLRDCTGKLFPC